jgi:hypothetical protein
LNLIISIDVFPNIGSDLTNINKDFVKYIDCPGQEGIILVKYLGATSVCAANPGSFADRKNWYIFLDGESIRFNGKPKYHLK